MKTRAKYIFSSIAKYSTLQRLVHLRGPGLENEMAALMQELTSGEARQGLDRIPFVLEDRARSLSCLMNTTTRGKRYLLERRPPSLTQLREEVGTQRLYDGMHETHPCRYCFGGWLAY